MKRAILLGVAILFAGSMVMSAGLDFPPDGPIPAGTYDYLNIGVGVVGSATASGATTITGATNTGDNGVGYLQVDAGASLNLQGTVSLGLGASGYASTNVDGNITADAFFFLGADDAALTGNASADLSINAGGSVNVVNTLGSGEHNAYIGGITVGGGGVANLTLNGSAQLTCYDQLSFGWMTGGGPGGIADVTINGSGGVIDAYSVKLAYGTIHYNVDMGGVTALTTTNRGPSDPEDPAYAGTTYIVFYGGIAPATTIDMGFMDPSVQAAMDLMTWDDAGRYVVIADASGTPEGQLHWGAPGDYNYSGPNLTGDSKWEMVERTTNVLEAHYMVPEPTTMALLGLGGLLAALRRRS